ncbi:MAG: histidine phosphatase family protein [Mycetocola sp.]
MRFLLIRHGETLSNLTGALDTAAPGAPLTARGLAQAAALGPALREEGVVAIYSSPLLRAKITADTLAEALGLEALVHPGLVEIGAGDLEMRTDEDATLRYVEYMLRWMQGDLAFEIPGSTTGAEFLDSFTAALTWIADEQSARSPVAVVTHGAAMRVFVALRAGLGVRDTERMWVENTGMAALEFNAPDDWTLTRWEPEPLGGAHLRSQDGGGEDVPPANLAALA